MKPSRRDPLRELQHLLRVPEDGAANIGAFLLDHAEELALALGSTAEDLRARADMPDGVVALRVRARPARRREIQQNGRRSRTPRSRWVRRPRSVLRPNRMRCEARNQWAGTGEDRATMALAR